ncbi:MULTISPECIES: bifunctional diaminohydroxyphosphoribosylaminopyrimidine deaminase/5-amino-6-(5-phosphoribosylamino)uracil reductase RibD [unclassified Moraxella]|uniref:bifunctional diaminohydroxyphosphoribosylaminopyrimidine deaminase/5-amino-6-(5-phosphoribosylamino)uracil reductase RibD n=1 Tax=unclassified Moraxella TaxID=2685852 RepID=UPI003AF59EFC
MTAPYTCQNPPLSDLPASADNQQHRYYMKQAIALAKRGLFTTRPNPHVGCVIVKDGRVIGEGYHYQVGQPHAEVFALRQAKASLGDDLAGATAYVTLEPCSHHGRTPPCADALIQANISRVVIAVTDPNPKVAGGGIAKLKQAGIDVITDICHDEAHALNRGFFRTMLGGLPYVRLKTACSLDGRISMANGESKWITGESAREDVQALRAMSGAIITGSQTVLADNPSLNVRSERLGVPITDIPQPLLVVLDRRGRIDKQSAWYQHQLATRPILLVQQPTIDLSNLLQTLVIEHHIQDVLIEAGACVSTAFLQAGLVDEWIVYQAPCILGATAQAMTTLDFSQMSQQLRMTLVSHETLDNDLKLRFCFD